MAKKEVKHVGYINEKLFCFNCGQSYQINYPQPVNMVIAMTKQFAEDHRKCKPVWKEPKADLNKPVKDRENWWLENGEQGLSSKTIFSVLSGLT